MSTPNQSFLGIEGYHAFVTGSAGGVATAVIRELLVNGCNVTAFDKRKTDIKLYSDIPRSDSGIFAVTGDLTDEFSLHKAFNDARSKFGPVQILFANAGITDESDPTPIWEMSTEKWDLVNSVNVGGTFLTIKEFLLQVKDVQTSTGGELENVSIIVTGSETGVFGQESHTEYASGKAGLQYGLVKSVKNEIVRLNSKARINAVAPGWINTPLIGDRLDYPREYWAEAQATVALKKIAQPEDVARCMVFLASHRTAGHITGQCISVDGGQEGRLLWKEDQVLGSSKVGRLETAMSTNIFPQLTSPHRARRMRICLSVDFDAISGYLGTGHTPENTMADYSAGIFSANVGVGRLLRLFAKHDLSDKLTWFIPGHSMETFPEETTAIVASGAEIGLHGYSHEGAYAMTVEQEKDVLEKCVELATKLKGKPPVGYRAPLYQIRETTVKLLQEHNFLYDSSMNAHDSLPYFLPNPFPGKPPHVPDYTKAAKSWMVPTPIPRQPSAGTVEAKEAMVEIPGSWYSEDMTPLGFYPYTASTQGYVSVDVVEKIWWDRFDWLWENESWLDEGPGKGYGSVYPLIWHPESSGRTHIIGMIDRFIGKLKARMTAAGDGEITFETMESVARSWQQR